MEVAFVGIGAMGAAMAPNVAEYLKNSKDMSKTLLIYNRSSDKAKQVAAKFPELSFEITDLSTIAKRASIIFMMLANDSAVLDTVASILAPEEVNSKVIIDCSTVQPETTETNITISRSKNVDFMTCPVLGRPDAAAARRLVMFLSGSSSLRPAVESIVGFLGRKTIDLGAVATQSNKLKLVANFHIIAAIEMISQGMTLAEKNGISRDIYLELINEAFPSPIISGYAARMARDEFASGTGFTVTLGLKDSNYIRRLAESSDVHLPLVNTAIEHLTQARAQGMGDDDWSSIIRTVRENSGMTKQK
mmetsp:Transcript_18058/g.32969  ORF Transcript_18058/g.32969 Transcript_18058/m.32969 type:complete len:305 (-) Transcript_18058:490-1404(-)